MRVKAFSATVPKQDLLQKEPPALATICFSTGLCLVRWTSPRQTAACLPTVLGALAGHLKGRGCKSCAW
ncbi:g9619 [Coccomyxa viridis]|uniref:G9619 protein n=1 Tax=Coccomyxa viridis TaxID=1274662 RepID=A0ABP1G5X3_9CHLO